MFKRIFVCMLLAVFSFTSKGQNPNPKILQDVFLEAEYFFLIEEYKDALTLYLSLLDEDQYNANLEYRIGTCYLNIKGQKDLSIEHLEKAVQNLSAKYKYGTIQQKAAPYDALLELARAYLVNYQFNNAKNTYERYINTLLPSDSENLAYVRQQIQACDNAKVMMDNPVKFGEENVGELFNDDKDNFYPLISKDGNTVAYMTSLKFYDAVMVSHKRNGKWETPKNITPELRIDNDIFISCLNTNGSILLFSLDDNYDSNIYMSKYSDGKWSMATKLNKNINTKYWESHGYLSEDGNTLIFSSNRPGGYGGLDLYISRKLNGEWGPAVNLGPEINTPFNEDRAFLIGNEKILFFCSQGHKSMGGYDIFRSECKDDGVWGTPENIGYPINTPDDDTFFMPINDGEAGYYSSAKEDPDASTDNIYKVVFQK